jgi:hypothetical protein
VVVPTDQEEEIQGTVKAEADEVKECQICLEELDMEKEKARIHECSNCRKTYHKTCLKTWLKIRQTCPTCTSIDEKALKLLQDSSVDVITNPASIQEEENRLEALTAIIFSVVAFAIFSFISGY